MTRVLAAARAPATVRRACRAGPAARLAALGAWLLVLPGCSAVYAPAPVGETPLALEPAQWEGTWLHRDGALSVAVADAGAGVLEVGWVERGQAGLEFEAHRVRLARSGAWLFGSAEDADRPGLFVWAAVARDGDQLTLWVPRPARVAALIDRGVLRGRALREGGEDVVLEALRPGDIERIMAPETAALDWEHPLVFVRFGSP